VELSRHSGHRSVKETAGSEKILNVIHLEQGHLEYYCDFSLPKAYIHVHDIINDKVACNANTPYTARYAIS